MKLSYSTNSIKTSSLVESCLAISKAGYSGVELCFSRDQFNPFKLSDKQLAELKKDLQNSNPVAISTATTFFLSDIPHEPSVISVDKIDRNERIEVVKQGIRVAKVLGVPCVSFQSGYLRETHKGYTNDEVNSILVTSIREILDEINEEDNIFLVIEPEPGMYIETVEEAFNLIKLVGHEKFKLHLDLCHTYCTEDNYLEVIDRVAPEVAYMHLADIKDGYNLRFKIASTFEDIVDSKEENVDGYLFYIQNEDLFYHVQDGEVKALQFDQEQEIKKSIIRENKAYIDSVEQVSFDILDKALPVLNNLRQSGAIKHPICNTIQGKVHYHEFPGNGEIDFVKVMEILTCKYNGYVTVELYNHADEWVSVLPDSFKYLSNMINKIYLERASYIGELDHRILKAPYVRLASANQGINGDYTCMYDLRFRQPNNNEYIDPIVMHSMEHALLYFFKKIYKNKFSCLAPMGCQTGFYLVLINELNSNDIIKNVEEILESIIHLEQVPYQSDQQCGQFEYHCLNQLQALAKEVLNKKHELSEVI
ncbi:S-ribosylhomocysteine lyase [Zooshikella harenae]|uniref:S-ribosylhomocysteine lyase n=1 Tax=Zooshikella harenae TaxID=2827238 RepID=A0ABS5ZHC0_9GAMM|nr:S-ribosylhomocysteine lyase [Zooshikella harenae]MBU2713454.1 S-ribosylhomocysteine lyase [Zooshikella harenae]